MTHRLTEYQKSFAAIFHYRHRYWTVYSQCFFQYSSAVSYSGTTDDRCFVPCGLVSLMRSFLSGAVLSVPLTPMSPCLPSLSPSVSLPADMVKNQWLLYSVEGLMSANEILSAMSHPSDSCWDNDWQKDRVSSIIYDLSHTQTCTLLWAHQFMQT